MKKIFIRLVLLLPAASIAVQTAHADYKQAVEYYSKGDYNRAIQELKPDLDKSPDWEFGHRLLGLCYLNINNNALAVTALSRAAELKSTAFSTYFGLGQAYFNMKRYGDAVSAFNRAETLTAKEENPEAEKTRVNIFRGTAYYRTDRFSEAAKDLQEAIRESASDWTLFFMLGSSFFNMNLTDEAIQMLEKSVTLKPGEPAVGDILGKAYLKKGVQALSEKRYQDAVQALLRAKAHDSNNGYINYNLGEAYIFEKRYADAEKELAAAGARLPDNAGVLARLGFVYERQNRNDQALKAYRRAYELSPSRELKETMDRVSENIKIKN